MTNTRRIAVLVGVLYIIGTVAGVSSVILTAPFHDAADVLREVADNEARLALAGVAVLTMGLALAMVPVVLYPLLRRVDATLALGYVVFRGALETFTYLLTVFGWLLLLPLSAEYVDSGAPADAHFQALGDVLLETEEAAIVTTFVFILGAVMLYAMLWRSELVPRWLSGWGLASSVPYIGAGFLVMFGATGHMSTLDSVLRIPLAIQEMVMALWLLIRGFDAAALAALED